MSATHQILISSYAKDFPWLGPCLRSLRKFCGGSFIPPVISVAPVDAAGAQAVVEKHFPEARVMVHCDPRGIAKGNLRAQISMMSGDVLCPAADYVWLVGSDCVIFDKLIPAQFVREDGRPIMLINSYGHLVEHLGAAIIIPWQVGTEKALGVSPNYEYMRRLPLVYPHRLFRAVREHIVRVHQVPFLDYVYDVHGRAGNGARSDSANFSESNIMGAFAHHFHPDMFDWQDIDNKTNDFPSPMIQFWSHGGLDRVIDVRIDYPGGNTFGTTPRTVITEILGPDAFA